ncbi:MAG: SGNH/GDSL hydrolase family protein [Opitutaceae bacterium]|jgi:lysophospholipase L1-like esterase|nr:SGNH/GDSL hydrolase family protein [Opitutaceae bacterium]
MNPALPVVPRHLLALVAGIFLPAAAAADVIPDAIPAGAGNLAHVAQKIRSGQPVRVGFLGGSITQGAGVRNHADCYYWKTRLRLAAFAKNTGSTLETILAAVGGTNSHYGAYRVGVQLLDKDIDLLVVEFAVNDLGNRSALDGMEGIVQQALARNPRTGIVLFHTTSRAMVENFYDKDELPPSVAAFHRVARHYNLAEVHAGPKVRTLFRDGQSAPESFFPDKTHPSQEGHAFYAKLLSDALLDALVSANKVPPPPPPPPVSTPAPLPAPLGSGQLARARLLPIIPVEKKGEWTETKPGYYTYVGSWKSTTPGASLTFDASGESIALLCVKATRLRVTGPGFEKTISYPGRPGGIPALQTLHAGPAPISGRVTVTLIPDDKGTTEADLAGIGVVPVPPFGGKSRIKNQESRIENQESRITN